MANLEVPQSLIKAIIFLRGESEGRHWLANLQPRIAAYACRWNLKPEAIAEGGAMSCCILCETAEGTEAVLKIPIEPKSGATESMLLDHWASSGAVPHVLDRDTDSGIFLMSRIRPGTTAWATAGPANSRQFLELMARLNQPGFPASPQFADIGIVVRNRLDWAHSRFADPRLVNDVASIKDAELVLNALLRTTTVRHLLHADLQAKNVLDGPDDRWYAIDPFGAVGDLNSEAALWATIQDGPTSIASRLAELGIDPCLNPARLRAWAFVFAIAEYRPYPPLSAQRMTEFLTSLTLSEVVDQIGEG